MMRLRNKQWLWGAGLAAVLVMAGVGGGLLFFHSRHTAQAEEPITDDTSGEDTGMMSVNVLHPRSDPSFAITVEEPAYVEAYYQANLQSRLPGQIKSVPKDIGARVTAGEVLAEVDVPDLVQDVAEKEAIVQQKRQELAVSQSKLKTAEARVQVAHNEVQEKQSAVGAAEATLVFRQKEFARFQKLAEGDQPAVTPDIVDERQKFSEAAKADYESAKIDVLKAQSDLEEAKAKLDAAKADIQLKQANIEVARKDRDKAQALADYAKIQAPFNGKITNRTIDPGSFVEAGGSSQGEPLLTVERTDIVTVYMKVPDNYAPFVTPDTEAIIQMSELPGVSIAGKVTRFAQSLRTADRTMRVEVDLYNRSAAQYQKFLADKAAQEDLKGGTLPLFPKITGKSAATGADLLPGMFGKMRLVLHKFKDSYLVPSTVVISQGGKPYIYEVQDGVARLVPVEVQADDGKLAKILILTRKGNEEIKEALTGREEIVADNQGEISPGQPVKVIPKEW